MAYTDTQVEHVAGLIQAYLGTAVKSVLRCPPALLPPATLFPCLTVYRRSSAILGPAPLRRHDVSLAIGYAIGRVPSGSLEDSWGALYAVALLIDEALQRRSHPEYPPDDEAGAPHVDAGKPLEVLASIHSVELQSVTYTAGLPDGPMEDGAYPAIECVARMVHTARIEPSNMGAIGSIALLHQEVAVEGKHGVEVSTVETFGTP